MYSVVKLKCSTTLNIIKRCCNKRRSRIIMLLPENTHYMLGIKFISCFYDTIILQSEHLCVRVSAWGIAANECVDNFDRCESVICTYPIRPWFVVLFRFHHQNDVTFVVLQLQWWVKWWWWCLGEIFVKDFCISSSFRGVMSDAHASNYIITLLRSFVCWCNF